MSEAAFTPSADVFGDVFNPASETDAERAARLAQIWEAQEAERARLSDAVAARARQDEDFCVSGVSVSFSIEDEDGGSVFESDDDLARWLSEDRPFDLGQLSALQAEISAALATWFNHYRAMGLARADNLDSHMMGVPAADCDDRIFYAVWRPVDGVEGIAALEPGYPASTIPLKALPGLTLIVGVGTFPVNASLLFAAARDHGLSVGVWGGEQTPEHVPFQGETRDEWLDRVCIPTAKLERLVKRWRRSGGNIKLFGLVGSASERAAGDDPVTFLVPGLIPVGEVSLLVGNQMAGKSTLAGELLAVIDSECQAQRFVLGTEIHARGVGVFVSGEDGDKIINARSAYYEPIHGPASGFVVDIADVSWPETLALLREIPEIAIVVVDPLRAVLAGDEDSSDNISRLFDDLRSLARNKSCSVLLVHHFSKKAPKNWSAMLAAVRGSGVITNRPRMVIGMIDRGAGVTDVAVLKHNLPIPAAELWGEINVGRSFRREASTLTLVPLGAPQRSNGAAVETNIHELIIAAISYYSERSEVVRKTGRNSLFARRHPSLVQLSRNAIEAGIAELLLAGRLIDGAEGLAVLAPAIGEETG